MGNVGFGELLEFCEFFSTVLLFDTFTTGVVNIIVKNININEHWGPPLYVIQIIIIQNRLVRLSFCPNRN